MSIDAILFDKDGTLFEFSATWDSWSAGIIHTLAEGAEELAHRLAAAIDFDLINQQFHPNSIAIAGTTGEIVTALLPHLPGRQPDELEAFLSDEAASAPLVEAAPLQGLLTELRDAGLKLGVMTNDSEASALTQLERAGVRDHFTFVAGCDSGFGAKPDPDPLLAFCQAAQVAPERTVMVGDSLHDLHAGRAAGMQRIGVLTGTATRSDLIPHADVVLNPIGEIPAWMTENR